ncbi:TetR/AcrR family transcriptional regulator [Pseudomonas sp. TMB3-21]
MPTPSLEPRKIPQQARAQATIEVILEGATQVLATDHLAGFNTNAIAERAGTSNGTFYQYFPNKEALLLALIRRQKQQMFINISASMQAASNTDLEGAVRLLIRGRMKHLRDNQSVAWILTQQEMHLPIHAIKAGYLTQGSELFASRLSHWGDTARGIDVLRAATTVPALVRGIFERWLSDRPESMDIAEQEAVCGVLGYLQCLKRIDRRDD